MPRNIPRAKKRAAGRTQPPNPIKVKVRERKRARKATEPEKFILVMFDGHNGGTAEAIKR